jgi:hypothetical protein
MQSVPTEPDLFAGKPGDAPATLCWIDGTILKGPPALPGGVRPSFDRQAVGVVDGEEHLIRAGDQGELEAAAP